ncbi:2',3'-cyclic-nucleotide 2'-phosphodiesterase [Elstera cyanobacteriorum]|uniref:2',3'-cyclic-nucleotide 2'-phosphodiesterase n=1 Tax=Elstera cyanobacteriorum TaxID=2022747 RepID=A0A255XV74_9PROT|nr:bifunctional 2',3'-cyclic-nucleotide 2'-phosphodiesterase/3'-nucleotidase [Elstera cyanobacteriorum]OYQ20917.1 2',3'-cyclic-nucleotide 2'-phosphodiesterase [Elstera cyanobacteriorum]GFZ97467.1 2',3'-cyclic-nucleotide 2'-phosphodiesterase [Elstera cyanobacteriorum]
MRTRSLVGLFLAGSLLTTPVLAQQVTAKLRLLQTTDLHTSLLNYDYYRDAEDNTVGLSKVATLIRQARTEAPNSLLIDNGDLLQGNPLGDYIAKVKGLKDGDTHPMYMAMNLIGYDAASLGNHEFNFGLPFLDTALKGAKFPSVSANIFETDGNTHRFKPYVILDRTVKDTGGKEHPIKIAVIGLTTPQIVQWDKAHLDGKIVTKDIVATAEAIVPEVKAKGADLIILAAHTGIGTDQVKSGDMAENAGWALTKVPGIHAVLTGHQHLTFPGQFKDLAGADAAKGTINGVPIAMPGFWGSHLGVFDLELTKTDGGWSVTSGTSSIRPIYKLDENRKRVPLVDNQPDIVAAVTPVHEEVLKYIRAPFGKVAAPIYSYFALVQDDPSVQIVSDAQVWYAQKALKGTKYENLPILSAAAPFKAGGRGGPDYYTDVPAGEIAIKNAADLYLYPNTVQMVTLTGAGVREWLEMSAGQFKQIDPNKSDPQDLVDTSFPTFNFDIIDGVTYEVDVTQPKRYDNDGKLVAPDARRIKNLAFQGKPIDDKQDFVIVTNNYRASGGGKFPGLDGKNIILQAPDENRQALIDFITEQKSVNPSADKNWRFAKTGKPVTLAFESGAKAEAFLASNPALTKLGDGQNGFVRYGLKLD